MRNTKQNRSLVTDKPLTNLCSMAGIAIDPASLQLPAFPGYTKQSAAPVTFEALQKKNHLILIAGR